MLLTESSELIKVVYDTSHIHTHTKIIGFFNVLSAKFFTYNKLNEIDCRCSSGNFIAIHLKSNLNNKCFILEFSGSYNNPPSGTIFKKADNNFEGVFYRMPKRKHNINIRC